MNLLKNIPYKEVVLVKDHLFFQGQQQAISLTKYYCEDDIHDRYYLRINTLNSHHEWIQQGYLYFYLDFENKESVFIGMAVSQEYRNCGIASLLIASWIQFCLDEGFLNLQTTQKQRKPFLLYLLKKYTFELQNLHLYQTSTKKVYICRKNDNNIKYIMFENKAEELRFRNSNVMRADNYEIINKMEPLEILDQVVLYSPYLLQDSEKAYQKSLQLYHK